jgi:tyrosine-protein kinase Etk/Wzc
MISDQNQPINPSVPQDFNLKKTLSLYTKKWPWFLSCVFGFLILSYIYLRYQIPQYAVKARIMLISENDQTSPSAMFKDISMFSENADAEIEDEILVMTSRGIMKSVTDQLDLNIQYFVQGDVLETEVYGKPPVVINFIASDSIINNTNFNFYINITSDVGFEYRVYEEDKPKIIPFGETIETNFGGMVITPDLQEINRLVGREYRVQLTNLDLATQYLRNTIDVYQSAKSSKVVSIYLEDSNIKKAKDIINSLINEYDRYSSSVKNYRAKSTSKFIDNRIELIASDLVNVDDSIVRFKTGNKITDVTSEAGQFLSSSAQNEQLLDENRTQLRLLSYMKASLGTDNDSFEPIPANLGMGDGTISSLSARYSELLSNRQRLMRSAGEKNVVVVELDQTLSNIRKNLRQNIDNAMKSLNIRINSLENQSSRINSKIFSVPGQERKLRSIERKQGIKESLYLYLLEKREEAAITLTANSPNLKVVDEPFSDGYPVSPNSQLIYIAALFAGLFIPFGFIYVKDLLDSKIHNKEDLEKLITDIPVLGEIPRLKVKELKQFVKRNDRSLLAESFRIIRTNFDYVKRGRHVTDYNNVLFVTSTINGEGKSFFSINMALTFANTNKRVLLIGADIRNPQIEFEPLKQKKKSGQNRPYGIFK